MTNLIWLARRYLAARGLRAWLTTAAVVLGVAMIYATSAAIPAMETAFARYMQSPDTDTTYLDTMAENIRLSNTAFSVIFTLFGAIALFVGAYLIGITFQAVVTERRRDLAVMRAIGAERRQVTRLITAEAALQGAVGSLIGAVIGQGIALALMRFLWDSYLRGRPLPDVTPFSPIGLIMALTIGIGVALVAGYFPARAAARVSPIEGMRPPLPAVLQAARWRIIVSIALLVSGVALLLFAESAWVGLGGVCIIGAVIAAAPILISRTIAALVPVLRRVFPRTADLVRASALRHPARTAATLSIMTVGFALFAGVGTMLAPIAANSRATAAANFRGSAYQLSPAAAHHLMGVPADPLTEADAVALAALPDVSRVAVYRTAGTAIDGIEVSVRAVDPALGTSMRSIFILRESGASTSFAAQQDANDAIVRALAGGGTAIISEGLARASGLAVGDDVTIDAPGGAWTAEVIAVASDYFPETGDVGLLLDQAVALALFPDAVISEIYIGITDESRRADLLAGIQSVIGERNIFIWDQLAQRDEIIASGERGMSIFYVLAGVVMIPSVLGLLNTLVIGLLERRREIGVLRASGADRGQVRAMVMAEALLLGVISAGVGLACGVALGYGVLAMFRAISQGNTDAFVFSLPVTALVTMLVVGMVIVWAAAWLPARRAARLDVLTALRAE